MFFNSPDALFQIGLSQQISMLRSRLDQSAIEMVTERKSDTLAAVRGDNDLVLRSQAVIDTAQSKIARLNVLEGRYRTAGLSLETIRELTGEATRAAQSAGDIGTGVEADEFAATEARSALAGIFSTLESRFGGRSLFGGTLGSGTVLEDVNTLLAEVETVVSGLTSAADVEGALSGYFAVGGGYETNIYLGGAATADPELETGRTLSTLMTANDDEIRGVLRGLAMVALNEQVDAPERSAFLRKSAEIVEAAREAIIAEEASMGLALNVLDIEIQRQEREVFNAELTLDNVLGRDPFEAASETQGLEARLRAAYTVTGRVAQLRLVNFL